MTLTQRIGTKLYKETKQIGRDIGHVLGFDESFYRDARGSRIVIYHGVCQRDHTRFNPIFIKLKTLEKHFQFYKKYFNVVSIDDFYEQKFSRDKFNVCITFDDGYANNHKYVLYLLAKYQLPATFFVTAIRDAGYDILWNDFLGMVQVYGPKMLLYKDQWFFKNRFNQYISKQSGKKIVEILRSGGFDIKQEMMDLLYPLVLYRDSRPDNEDYWLQMTQQQIRELALSPFATIGSHGYYHNDLAQININDAYQEMVSSRQYLENIIDQPVTSLAFPYGTYNMDVINASKRAGYSQLLCTDFNSPEDQADPMMKERFTVNPFISTLNQMRATVTRRYE
ncbi:MAG TPA: polysaccharide deacetylase family protein [Mucilaginibacter sp.]|jgi:peptidoglycan/xylan/chitin deacetylase (PgdA/CDA1 family)|nr:polysaccharide deacetylase family protein [Mucilaginibacter sp.]